MLFSQSEIEALLLAGWLKLIPRKNNFAFSMFSPAGIKSLLIHNLMYITQNEKYLCLTPTGWDFIKSLGYDYPQDSGYISNFDTLLRREQCAKMAMLFYRAGFNIFEDSIDALQTPCTYLTSTASRRDMRKVGTKLWQGVRMAGIATCPQESYLVHYTDNRGLLLNSELSLFQKLIHNEGRCVFAADSYFQTALQIKSEESFAATKSRRGWVTFSKAYERLDLPVHLLECSDVGAMQLQTMSIPNYRQKLAQWALREQYRPPLDELCDITDAFLESENLPLVILLDMNIKRAESARRKAKCLGFPKIGIISIKEQTTAISYLLSDVESLEGYILTPEAVIYALGLKLFEPSAEAYQLPDGRCLTTEDIPKRQKAGRPIAKSADADIFCNNKTNF